MNFLSPRILYCCLVPENKQIKKQKREKDCELNGCVNGMLLLNPSQLEEKEEKKIMEL